MINFINFLKNVRGRIHASGFATMYCVWLICCTAIAIQAKEMSPERAFWVLLVAGPVVMFMFSEIKPAAEMSLSNQPTPHPPDGEADNKMGDPQGEAERIDADRQHREAAGQKRDADL